MIMMKHWRVVGIVSALAVALSALSASRAQQADAYLGFAQNDLRLAKLSARSRQLRKTCSHDSEMGVSKAGTAREIEQRLELLERADAAIAQRLTKNAEALIEQAERNLVNSLATKSVAASDSRQADSPPSSAARWSVTFGVVFPLVAVCLLGLGVLVAGIVCPNSEAGRLLSRALQDDADALVRRAVALTSRDRYRAALGKARRAVQLQDELAEGWFLIGYCHCSGQPLNTGCLGADPEAWRLAVEAFGKALNREASGSALSTHHAILALLSMGAYHYWNLEFDAAQDCLKNALKRGISDDDVLAETKAMLAAAEAKDPGAIERTAAGGAQDAPVTLTAEEQGHQAASKAKASPTGTTADVSAQHQALPPPQASSQTGIAGEFTVNTGAFGLASCGVHDILAVGCGESVVSIFDTRSWQRTAELRLPILTDPKAEWPERDESSKRVWHLSFSADGAFLCCATDWDLVVFRTTDWSSHFSVECANRQIEGTRICWLGDSHRLLFADSDYDGHVFFHLDMDSPEMAPAKCVLPVTKADGSIRRVLPTATESRILAFQSGPPEYRPCRVVDLGSSKALHETSGLDGFGAQSSGDRVLSSSQGWLCVYAVDDSGRLSQERQVLNMYGLYPYTYWFSPDGTMALVALDSDWDREDAPRSLIIAPLSSEQPQLKIDVTGVHRFNIRGAVTCDDNRLVVTCDQTGRVVAWDLPAAPDETTASRSPEQVQAIINGLPSARTDPFPAEARVLVECGADAVPMLIEDLHRSSVIPRILALIGDRQAVPPLMDLLRNGGVFDSDGGLAYPEYARVCAAEALGELGGTDALPLLREIKRSTSVWELATATENAIKLMEQAGKERPRASSTRNGGNDGRPGDAADQVQAEKKEQGTERRTPLGTSRTVGLSRLQKMSSLVPNFSAALDALQPQKIECEDKSQRYTKKDMLEVFLLALVQENIGWRTYEVKLLTTVTKRYRPCTRVRWSSSSESVLMQYHHDFADGSASDDTIEVVRLSKESFAFKNQHDPGVVEIGMVLMGLTGAGGTAHEPKSYFLKAAGIRDIVREAVKRGVHES